MNLMWLFGTVWFSFIVPMYYKVKYTCNIRQEYALRFFSNDNYNSVAKDVQLILLPLNLMQYIMFCPKYCIKNNLISQNSHMSNFVSVIGTLAFILLFIYRTYRQCFLGECLDCNSFLYASIYFDGVFYCMLFIMNFSIGVIYTKKSVKFVLTFQKVHRFLNNETSFNNLIIWNWVIVIVFLCGYVSLFTFYSTRQNALPYTTLCLNVLISFDLNVIYASRVIRMLESKVVLWNINACCTQEMECMYKENFGIKMFEAYIDILECYDIYKVCFQHYILYHIIETFVHSLVYIQVSLEMFKMAVTVDDAKQAALLSLPMLSWMIKDLGWQAILSKQCEKFYIAIQSVQDSCGLILKSTCSDQEKRLCKNVLRLHRASFSKIRVCGLFYVDAALQLSLTGLLVNYIFVLLQFAIL